MISTEILYFYDYVQNLSDTTLTKELSECLTNSLNRSQTSNIRPNSYGVEGALFGDEGKGAVMAKINHQLYEKHHQLYSLRYNGGGNAGHEAVFNGLTVVTHQLPMAIAQEGATAIISRGMVIHPTELIVEMDAVEQSLGTKLPANLLIDGFTPLALDTHRAIEKIYKQDLPGSKGSTGRGIAPAYSSLLLRNAVFFNDLFEPDYQEIFGNHYDFCEKQLWGFGANLAEISVYNMKESLKSSKPVERPVGTKREFIEKLELCREVLKPHLLKDAYHLLGTVWNNPSIPITFEGAQGMGLDPYHGVYPDVTASRPGSNFISDATYGRIIPNEIAYRMGTLKTYTSSVGCRNLPNVKNEQWETDIQIEFKEKGKSTGRLRGISPIPLSILEYLRRVAGYDFLAVTHLDAIRPNQPMRVITHYSDRKSGLETPYIPYQQMLNNLDAHCIEFAGCDEAKTIKAKNLKDLPPEIKRCLLFLSRTIAPTIYSTHGPDLEDYISCLPGL
ncbi:MAG: adenylosuccinate synthetase [Candidatus Daviesbacteria bacterium]|nr:adenylosuccinate synthetase [Candidatus Daviesbacteria bacterium]